MSAYLGDFALSAIVRKCWNSNGADGASITRGTNGTISVYKDGGLTQSTTGVTDTEDFDGLTGVHLVAIDTSADATFYSAGSEFEVVLSAATIDGKTVNASLFSFSIKNRSMESRVPTAAAGAAGGLAIVGSSMALTSGERSTLIAALLDLTDGIEAGVTPRTQMKVVLAMLAGLVSGAGSGTESFENPGGTKTRAVVEVDADGNRSAVVLDGS